MEDDASTSNRNIIYKISRTITRKENTLYNALRSIYQDSIFVSEIRQLWPELPLLANLRCGLWYSTTFDGTCYFKSTDGHTKNLSFNTARLNLHVALIAGQKGGCMIVDSTRKGKRFPDSMSKTIPIWTCVLNRAIGNYRKTLDKDDLLDTEPNTLCKLENIEQDSLGWDCSLHLPLWVSETEKAMIENRLETWTEELEASGADIASISSSLKKPLKPLWISQRTVIWLNEVPEYDSWDFTPIILVSASSSSSNDTIQHRTTSEFSWNYIAGAGDDEESWSRGLSPDLFWKHAYDIISSGPDPCNQKVLSIVEQDRVRRAQRGENAPQITVKPSNCLGIRGRSRVLETTCSGNGTLTRDDHLSGDRGVAILGSTNIAVGKSQLASEDPIGHCILNCISESSSVSLKNSEIQLNLPIVDSKFDRFSLLRSLPSAMRYAEAQLRRGNKLLICCKSGEDVSVCVALSVLTALFDGEGNFDNDKFFLEKSITKSDLRRRLVFICKFAVNARPSRGNLKQVFAFLSGKDNNPPIS